MGVILPFLRGLRVGDWSSAERARLLSLGERLAPEAGAEVVFGSTDAGEPWCVVTDLDGEVLIHVARINGRFVVHDAAADVLEEGAELWSLLLHVLRTPEPEVVPAEILAFPLQSRQAQTLVALITAAAFLSATEMLLHANEAAAPADPDDRPQPAATADVLEAYADATPDRQAPAPPAAPGLSPAPEPQASTGAPPPAAAQVAETAKADAPPTKVASPASSDAPPRPAPDLPIAEPQRAVEGPVVLAGTAGDDRLVGTEAAEVLLGGDGEDTLDGGGAPSGEEDRLDGGAGADTLILAATVIASGGPGADRFVLPAEGGDAGVILDYRAFEGDRIETADGRAAIVLAAEPTEDVLSAVRGTGAEPPSEARPGVRLSLDTDANGVADAFVLVAEPEPDRDAPQPVESPVTPDFSGGADTFVF